MQLDHQIVMAAMLEADATKLQQLWQAGVTAILLPGTDGVCAGFYTTSHDLQAQFRQHFKQSLAEMSIPHIDTCDEQPERI